MADRPVAWFRVDADDNDPMTFLLGLANSLRRINDRFNTRVDSLSMGIPNVDRQLHRFISLLGNDMIAASLDPFALVIDDWHHVTEPAIHQALDYFLEHHPPQISLVIATRYDPPLALARMRVRGQLAELQLDSLLFRTDEVRALLNGQSQLDLSDEALQILESKTAGWAASLRLLAVSLIQAGDAARHEGFIHQLARTDRHIFDFLAE